MNKKRIEIIFNINDQILTILFNFGIQNNNILTTGTRIRCFTDTIFLISLNRSIR